VFRAHIIFLLDPAPSTFKYFEYYSHFWLCRFILVERERDRSGRTKCISFRLVRGDDDMRCNLNECFCERDLMLPHGWHVKIDTHCHSIV